MVKISQDTTSFSGPWVAEFGLWELVNDGILTGEECSILEGSSARYEILKCKVDNIHFSKLKHGGKFLQLQRSNGDIETWSYSGQSRVNPEENLSYFYRPA